MRHLDWVWVGGVVLAAAVSGASVSHGSDVKAPPPVFEMPKWASVPRGDNAFAVVELFTTEASPVCLAADTLLARIAKDVAKSDVPVFTLAFHADFWDFTGWTDLYGDPEYTARLRGYLERAGLAGMRIPLFVLNGGEATIGGLAGVVPGVVKVLSEARRTTLRIAPEGDEAAGFRVRYELSAPLPGHLLSLAVVEDGVESEIVAGDNAGLTLHHQSLVRSFVTKTLDEAESGVAQIGFPDDAVLENLAVIAYVQDPQTLRVQAAARFP